MLWESIRNKITRKIIIFYLGGWKARGIPKGGFGRVLVRKEKKGEKFWSAVSTYTIVCGGVLGGIFAYLERIYLEGQFLRGKFCSKTTCEIAIQWPFFSLRNAMYIIISTMVCSPVHLFEKGT